MGVEGVIERLAINVLGVLGQDALEIFGQVGVAGVGHSATSGQAPSISRAIDCRRLMTSNRFCRRDFSKADLRERCAVDQGGWARHER